MSDERTAEVLGGEVSRRSIPAFLQGRKGQVRMDCSGRRRELLHAMPTATAERRRATRRAARSPPILASWKPPSNGKHGWFWRNRTSSPVTITLKTSGAYGDIKRVMQCNGPRGNVARPLCPDCSGRTR
jgi:hypothetical protein